MSVEITATKLPIRTKGDGHWKKYTYQDCTFVITLSGLLTFDEDNWTGWDMLDNIFNFAHVLVRTSFNDENGNIRTVQGYVMIETATLTWAPGALVKDDFQLQGNGKMDIFDGYVPCASIITAITFDGLDDPDGNVTVDYTYTGDAYQVKYRIDAIGDYLYAIAKGTIALPASAIGDHSIEIIPVCQNGYEGTGDTAEYNVTHDTACPAAITDISIDGSYVATNTHTGPASIMRYKIDGESLWHVVPINTPIPLGGLSAGNHTIKEQPGCTIGLWGTSFTKNFTIASQPAQSQIKYSTSFEVAGSGVFNIYVDGVLVVSLTATHAETSIYAPTGSAVKVVLTAGGGRAYDLKTVNETTSTTLNEQAGSGSLTTTYQYTFAPSSGSVYNLTGTLTEI